jgi:hypothetical protein
MIYKFSPFCGATKVSEYSADGAECEKISEKGSKPGFEGSN